MLPRRAVIAITTTAIALALLLNFKTPSAPILGTTPLAVGQPLGTLPLWLADNLAVPLELEASYEETCRILRIP